MEGFYCAHCNVSSSLLKRNLISRNMVFILERSTGLDPETISNAIIFYMVIFNDKSTYCQTPNIGDILEGNKIVGHSDVVGASPVGCCPNYIFILELKPGFSGLGKDNCKRNKKHISLGIWCVTYIRGLTVGIDNDMALCIKTGHDTNQWWPYSLTYVHQLAKRCTAKLQYFIIFTPINEKNIWSYLHTNLNICQMKTCNPLYQCMIALY